MPIRCCGGWRMDEEEIQMMGLTKEIVAEMRACVGKELIRQIKAFYPVLADLPDSEFEQLVEAWMGPV